jgi:hypothetical protein
MRSRSVVCFQIAIAVSCRERRLYPCAPRTGVLRGRPKLVGSANDASVRQQPHDATTILRDVVRHAPAWARRTRGDPPGIRRGIDPRIAHGASASSARARTGEG